jgi:hypothetical protein
MPSRCFEGAVAKHCTVCASAEKTRIAAEMIADGATDTAIGEAVGVGRMSVFRHRTAHVLAPARALAEAAGKGREVTEQRAQMLAAAEAGDPMAFIGLQGIVADLKKVHERLEKTADAAEKDDQRLAVASLNAQQLRATEVRAKMGGVCGYAPPKAVPGGGTQFSLVMHFGDGKDIVIGGTPVDSDSVADIGRSPRVIEGTLVLPAMVGATDIPDLDDPGNDNAEFDEDA